MSTPDPGRAQRRQEAIETIAQALLAKTQGHTIEEARAVAAEIVDGELGKQEGSAP